MDEIKYEKFGLPIRSYIYFLPQESAIEVNVFLDYRPEVENHFNVCKLDCKFMYKFAFFFTKLFQVK